MDQTGIFSQNIEMRVGGSAAIMADCCSEWTSARAHICVGRHNDGLLNKLSDNRASIMLPIRHLDN